MLNELSHLKEEVEGRVVGVEFRGLNAHTHNSTLPLETTFGVYSEKASEQSGGFPGELIAGNSFTVVEPVVFYVNCSSLFGLSRTLGL